MLRDKFRLSKERAEILYSIGAAIFIPLIIILGSVITAVTVKKDFEDEQKHKVELTSSVINRAVNDNLDKRSVLQKQLEDYQISDSELEYLAVIRPQPNTNKYITTESTNRTELAKISQDVSFDLVVSSKQPVSQVVRGDNGRTRQVLSPIIKDDHVIAIVAINISLQHADSLMHSTLIQSLLIGSATVLLIIVLLINDVLFLEHALLPKRAKQEDDQPIPNDRDRLV